MACPNCGAGAPVGTACPACGFAAPAADQFGTPMPSGLSGYAPPPTTAQLYSEPTYVTPAPSTDVTPAPSTDVAPAPSTDVAPAPPAYVAPAPPWGNPAPAPAHPAAGTWIAPAPPWEAPPVGVPYNASWAPAAPVGNTFSIVGIVLGAMAVLFCPVIFGLAAIAMAQRAHKRGESLWKTSMGVAVGGLVGGLILARILMAFTSLYDFS